MRYMAVLTNVEGLERDQHVFAQEIDGLNTWITNMLRLYPEGMVSIYETRVELVRRVAAEVINVGGAKIVKLIPKSIT